MTRTDRVARQYTRFRPNAVRLIVCGVVAALMAALVSASAAEPVFDRELSFSIPSQSLASALMQFAEQSKVQVLTSSIELKGYQTQGVQGQFSIRAALERILSGTDLSFKEVGEGTVTIGRHGQARSSSSSKTPSQESMRSEPTSLRLAQAESQGYEEPRASAERPDEHRNEAAARSGIPEVLVTGSRILNTDIRRTRDDVQPYVIFERETIERSGAVSVEDFLKQRLPMNTQASSFSQSPDSSGNRSQINLRGLGTNQTLILIDGRRTSNTNIGGQLLQADLNGIPMSAIERIEVLPTTASGIYGGDATGGVINVILRRDYSGTEFKFTSDNTFDTDSTQSRIDLSTGFSLGADTSIMLTASHARGNVLMQRDRDFVEGYRREAFANNASLYLPPASPPLGYLPNLRSADGTTLVLDDGTPLESSFTHVPAGYAGFASDGGEALLANAGTYEFGLANSGGSGRAALLNVPEVTSGIATIRHEFTPRVDGFIDLAASNNVGHYLSNQLDFISEITLPADAPNNPFEQDIQVRSPLLTEDFSRDTRNTDRRVAAGLIVRLPGDWRAEVDYLWSQTSSSFTDQVYAQLTPEGMLALQDGTLDILRDPNANPIDLAPYLIQPGIVEGPRKTTTRNPTLILGGPVGEIAGGRPVLSVRLEHRDEDFATTTVLQPGSAAFYYPSRSQTVSSAFAGMTVPLFSALNARPGVRSLETQLSARHDRYDIESATGGVASPTDPVIRIDSTLSSTNVTAGFRWQPIEDAVLRASYGTGFLPPNVNQLVPGAPFTLSGFPLDPRRGNTPLGVYQFRGGGHPDLQPEESESLSAGVILTPRFLPGVRLSVDYTRIEKTDNIATIPGGPQGLLDNEERFPDRVIRGENLPGDPPDWQGPVIFLDATRINLARAELEAYDVQLDYSHETPNRGTFYVFAVATWQTHYKTQLLEGLPIIENIGFQSSGSLSSPLKLKGNLGATWQYRNLTLGWVSRYFDSYRPYTATASSGTIESTLQTQGAPRVDDQLYHDLTAKYAFDDSAWLGRLGDGLSVQLGVRNVFNETPPRELEAYSSYGDPRLASYWLTLSKSFTH